MDKKNIMDNQANEEFIKEIERLEAQINQLLEEKRSLLKEKKELLREIERLTYSG